MPVPDSYSQRYGREETTYSTSYSRGTRSSYLSSYSSAKQSSSLPPRPPSLYGSDALRKYGDPTSSLTSRYLTGSSSSSRIRDYGGSGGGAGTYRSSISPVRATTNSALRSSIADRIKAIDIDGKEEDSSPLRSYSRYSTLRSRDPPSPSPIGVSRAYTSTYARDRSNSREYGVSPLAALQNSHRERDSSLTRAENQRKRGSPSPTSAAAITNGGTSSGPSSRKDSGIAAAAAAANSTVVAVNGTTASGSSSEVKQKSSTSSSSCEKTGGDGGVASTKLSPSDNHSIITTDNRVVTVTDADLLVSVEGGRGRESPLNAAVILSDRESSSRRACVRDLENNLEIRGQRLGRDSSKMEMMSNGNSPPPGEEGDGGSGGKKEGGSSSVVVMLGKDRKVVKSVSSSSSTSSSALKEVAQGGGATVGVAETETTSSSDSGKVMENDLNGNPIPMEGTKQLAMKEEGTCGAKAYEKKEGSSSPSITGSGGKGSAGLVRRRKESDSNANNLVDGGNGVNEEDKQSKVSISVNREASPHESFTICKPRKASITGGSSSSAPAGSRVIYHSIKVEESAITKSPSPEPISFTVKAPPPLSSPVVEGAPFKTETSAEFKVSLPRRRSSAAAATTASSSLPTNEHSHSNGNLEGDKPEEGSTLKQKMNLSSSPSTRQSVSPPKSGVSSAPSRVQRKSGSPAAIEKEKPTPKKKSLTPSSVKNDEDSASSSVEDDQSDREPKPRKHFSATSTSRSSQTPPRSSPISVGSTRKSKSKSPSPRVTSAAASASSSSPSKYLNGDGGENVNGYNEMGPHTSKFNAYTPPAENSSSLATNRNDSKKGRYPHLSGALASDSSDNDSDAFSSSPQLGGRFRSREGHERAGLTGLRNIGNTCFMNSVLQCLSNTKPLLEYVIRDNFTQDINSSTSAMKGCLMRAFSEVIQELWREQRVVDTSAFKDQIQKFAPRFMGYSQQDAQEFLRYLLEGYHEDVNRVTAKPTPILTDIDDSLSDSQKAAEAWKRYLRYEDSRIVDIFVGQLRSTLKCTVCGNCSVTFDPFWDLSLPIPSRSGSIRLAQCFELFNKEEVLDGDEKPTCSKCQCRRKCTKSFSIQKFPRILVIHLKRFSPTERYRGKLSTLVDCPINSLDLSTYAANRGSGQSYNLYGVANHSGSTYSGHYIAYCKHPYSGEWHSYNDSRVSPISSHQVITTEGYVLFYEQSGQSS